MRQPSVTCGLRPMQIRRRGIDLQRLREEQIHVDERDVPNHSLAGHGAEEREQHEFQVAPASDGVAHRRLRQFAVHAHLLEYRRLLELQADVNGNAQQDD